MKTWRLFVGLIILAGVIEFLTPLLSAKTGIIIPLIQQNCGAVPVFLKDIMAYESAPNPAYWEGFMTCGLSVMVFILMPGFLKISHWLYRFVNPKKSKPQIN